jgi:hypothetical protein
MEVQNQPPAERLQADGKTRLQSRSNAREYEDGYREVKSARRSVSSLSGEDEGRMEEYAMK